MTIKDIMTRRHGKDPSVRRNGDPFEALQRTIDRLFEEFRRGSDLEAFSSLFSEPSAFDIQMPQVDVAETDEDVQVSADLPGIDEKNVEVILGNHSLTIRGEKSSESEERKKSYHVKERAYGSFHRVVALPEDVDADKAKATFKKGVLTVVIPKTHEAKAKLRKIAVQAA
jgi:HSP20 family protein